MKRIAPFLNMFDEAMDSVFNYKAPNYLILIHRSPESLGVKIQTETEPSVEVSFITEEEDEAAALILASKLQKELARLQDLPICVGCGQACEPGDSAYVLALGGEQCGDCLEGRALNTGEEKHS